MNLGDRWWKEALAYPRFGKIAFLMLMAILLPVIIVQGVLDSFVSAWHLYKEVSRAINNGK